MTILVTGASGLIGRAVVADLVPRHRVMALNRRPLDLPGVAVHQADIADAAAIAPAFAGVDTVIHLAAEISDAAGWPALLRTNVEGTRNVFACAVEAGVRKVVFASSGATVAGWEHDEPYRALVSAADDALPADWRLIGVDEPTRPRGVYGATKVWGEALARHLADTTTTAFTCIRFGWVSAADRPEDVRQRSVYCSQRDAVSAVRVAVEQAPPARFCVFFANSANRRGYRDLQAGAALFGWQPRDSAEAV